MTAMTMQMNRDESRLLRKAAEESEGVVSVGGLVTELREVAARVEGNPGRKVAFARFVELSRRRLRLKVEDLAKKAQVDVSELLGIEQGDVECPEPRTVYRLAGVLKVPQERLLELSGLAVPRDVRFQEAAIRFVARSERMDALSREEETALQEFVKILAVEPSSGGA
jgi:transcriptional regulator with XRE-family HTH domain